MQKVVTNANPEIHGQNGGTQQEPVLVGSATSKLGTMLVMTWPCTRALIAKS